MASQRAIILGGGLSGLSAAIRLSHFGWDVTVFEKHTVPGGLNSYYTWRGAPCDVGLHAMTHIGTPEDRSSTLNRLLRQLRIRRDALQLCPQGKSSIVFPEHTLEFSNDETLLIESVAQAFPHCADAFGRFLQKIKDTNPFTNERDFVSARRVLEECLPDCTLREMLLLPTMYYGNPCVHDMDWRQFCIVFRGIFIDGLARPAEGIQPLIQLLTDRMAENGAVLRLHHPITAIHTENGHVRYVSDAEGNDYTADIYISCLGCPETGALCTPSLPEMAPETAGKMSFAEFLFELNAPLSALGLTESISFQSTTSQTNWTPIDQTCDFSQSVLCFPENFAGVHSSRHQVRLTCMAGCDAWNALPRAEYKQQKLQAIGEAMKLLDAQTPGFAQNVVASDMYTPKTFTRFTGRANGAIYGAPVKWWDGQTPLTNLMLSGTDQGYLGIIGALLSGITIANKLLL